MLGIGKNMGIFLLTITVILSAAAFLTTQNLDKSTNDVGFLVGHVTLKVTDENGYIKNYLQTDNVIVDGGWNNLVLNAFSGDYTVDFGSGPGALQSDAPSPFSHIGIGNGTGTPLSTDASLFGELPACDRSTLEIFSDGASSTSGSSITVSLFAEFDAFLDSGCAGDAILDVDISEAGLFNGTASQNTVMFAHTAFSPTVPPLGPFDFLEIQWDFTFSSGP